MLFRHNFGHYDTHVVILIQKWLFRDKSGDFEYEIHIMNGHLVTKMAILTKMSHFDNNESFRLKHSIRHKYVLLIREF